MNTHGGWQHIQIYLNAVRNIGHRLGELIVSMGTGIFNVPVRILKYISKIDPFFTRWKGDLVMIV